MRIGITDMPEKSFTLQPLIGTGNVLIQMYRYPEEDYDSDGHKHITANVLNIIRRNYEGLAQDVESNFEWYWQQGEQEESKKLTDQFTVLVQKWMNDIVKKKNYDDVQSAATYIYSSDTKFAAEGNAVVKWRDKVWRHCYDVIDDIVAGKRGVPSVNELLRELPSLEW